MKRETALRYAREIARRVHSVNGLLATPHCSREAARISRIWVFGSTVKGSESPNDLDLLIEINSVGRSRKVKNGAKLDKACFRSYGIRSGLDATDYALKWLTKGMKMVSRHTTNNEGAKIDVKVLLYPRNDLEGSNV